MSDWCDHRLGEIVEVLDSHRVPVREEDRPSGSVPYYGANGQQGWIDRPLFDEPLVLLAEDGGHFEEFADRPIAYRIDGPSWVNNHAHVLRATSLVSHNFLFWSLRNKDIRRWIAGGTRSKLTQAEMGQIVVTLPPPNEQRRIAEILDAIDETIQATERVIAKHKQVRSGLASDLLSGKCGSTLRESQESRDVSQSCVPRWEKRQLGDIGTVVGGGTLHRRNPQDWGMAKWVTRCLGDVARLKMGQSPPGSWVTDLDNGLPFLQGNAEFGPRHPTAKFQCEKAVRQCAPGDSLISVRAPVGAVNRANLGYGIGRGLAAVIFDMVDPDFGHHALVESSRELQRVAQGTTFSAIGRNDLAALQLPVPPLEEQRRIAEIFDAIDETIRSNEEQRDKLQRVRSGLAADLLSGRVRTVAA